VFLFIKYYFRLFGKKLWQFTFYLVVLNIIGTVLVILLSR
jgi:hypothetical protein